jgi:hypothetical protein
MESIINTSSENNGDNENNKGSILSNNVKDILKRKKEKSKKNMKRMNFSSILPENLEIDNNNTINDIDNENEEEKMIDINERNQNVKELENKAKKSYQSIYDKHNNLDINFKANEIIKNNKNNIMSIFCKEIVFIIINIISFAMFYLSFTKRTSNDIIYYYFIYPINKISLILLLVNASVTGMTIILVKINQISIIHICYSLIFYLSMYFKHPFSYNIPFFLSRIVAAVIRFK